MVVINVKLGVFINFLYDDKFAHVLITVCSLGRKCASVWIYANVCVALQKYSLGYNFIINVMSAIRT